MIDLIYQCSANRIAAKSPVDRILEKLDGPKVWQKGNVRRGTPDPSMIVL